MTTRRTHWYNQLQLHSADAVLSLTHQQISNHICIERVLRQRNKQPKDSWVYSRWWRTVNMQSFCVQLGRHQDCDTIAMCRYMCMSLCCSSHLLWRYAVLGDHSHHYPITGTSKWFERLAFLVLIWVEKESSNRQTDLTCMNITILQLLLFLHRNACGPKLGWQCPFLRMWLASRMAQCDTRKSKIRYLQLLSEVGELFSLWVQYHLTSPRIRTRKHGIQSRRKHAVP